MKIGIKIAASLVCLFSCTNTNLVQFKKVKKGLNTLSGKYINDTIPHGIIETFDALGHIVSKENYKYGVLDGEAVYYYKERGTIKVKANFVNGLQAGMKYAYDSSGNLINAVNYYFDKEIGSDFSYDSLGMITEYSFQNFETDMLYYCYFDNKSKKYVYPSDAYLIKAKTQIVLINNKDEMLSIFLYLLNPPKLRLEYRICVSNEKDSLLTVKQAPSDNFYYEYSLRLRDNKQKVAIVLDRYDSALQKKMIIIKYLKTTYP